MIAALLCFLAAFLLLTGVAAWSAPYRGFYRDWLTAMGFFGALFATVGLLCIAAALVERWSREPKPSTELEAK